VARILLPHLIERHHKTTACGSRRCLCAGDDPFHDPADGRIADPADDNIVILEQDLAGVVGRDCLVDSDEQVDKTAFERFQSPFVYRLHFKPLMPGSLVQFSERSRQQHFGDLVRRHDANSAVTRCRIKGWRDRDGRPNLLQHRAHRFDQPSGANGEQRIERHQQIKIQPIEARSACPSPDQPAAITDNALATNVAGSPSWAKPARSAAGVASWGWAPNAASSPASGR
jgi:hypothetical protein